MVFKNSDAFSIYKILVDSKETGKLGFVIAKNRRKFEQELTEYFTKYDELVMKYGVDNGNGAFRIPEENFGAYTAELTEYNNMECDIPITTIDEETFCSGGLTSQEMFALDWMVQE